MNPLYIADDHPVYSYSVDRTPENYLVLRNFRMTADERDLLAWLDAPQERNVKPEMEDSTSLQVEQHVDRDSLAMQKWKHIRRHGDSGCSSPASHKSKDASEASRKRREHTDTTSATTTKPQTKESSATAERHTSPSRGGLKTLRESTRRSSKKIVKPMQESSGRAQESGLYPRGFSIPSGWTSTIAGGESEM